MDNELDNELTQLADQTKPIFVIAIPKINSPKRLPSPATPTVTLEG